MHSNGFMTLVDGSLDAALPVVMRRAAVALPKTTFSEPLNVLHIGIAKDTDPSTFPKRAQAALLQFKGQLAGMDVRTVNFVLPNPGATVLYFNFFAETGFAEDPISRNMRPTMPQLLELNRLTQNHELERMLAVGRNAYLFLGKEKPTAGSASKVVKGERQQVLFLRALSMSEDSISPSGAERVLTMALDDFDRAMLDPRVSDTASSRIFLNILPDASMSLDVLTQRFQKIMDGLISKYATRLLKLRVDEIEVKLRVGDPVLGILPMRLIATSAMGGWLKREVYREYLDPVTGQTQQYCTVTGDQSVCVLDPYPTSSILQLKRATARRVGSTYANDFLGLFEIALLNTWQAYLESLGKSSPVSMPVGVFDFEELVLDKTGQLRREKRFPGSNKVGMLAWHVEMKTPHYPMGREAVIIANDVTIQSGSFGVQEVSTEL